MKGARERRTQILLRRSNVDGAIESGIIAGNVGADRNINVATGKNCHNEQGR
jgi:hypothetical protein